MSLTPFVDIAFVLTMLLVVMVPLGTERTISMNVGLPSWQSLQCEWTHSVNLSADGVVTIGSVASLEEFSDLSLVQEYLEQLHYEYPNCLITIQADPKAKAGTLVQLQDMAYSAGHSKNVVVVTESVERRLMWTSDYWTDGL